MQPLDLARELLPQSTQQIWTAMHHDGPDQIGLWLQQLFNLARELEIGFYLGIYAPRCSKSGH